MSPLVPQMPLLPEMGLTAVIRNLATMTKVGLLKPLSSAVNDVIMRLENMTELKSARIHPVAGSIK